MLNERDVAIYTRGASRSRDYCHAERSQISRLMWSRCVTQKLRARDVRSMSFGLANVEDAALDVLDVLELVSLEGASVYIAIVTLDSIPDAVVCTQLHR